MQSGAGARPEYANKTLVALKRMKKRWEGGWDECKRLKELEVRPLAHSLPLSLSPYLTHSPSRCELYLITLI